MKQPGTLTAWVNDRFTPLGEARVHIEDRGFQFADGIYEVIACFGGTFIDLDEHLARLWRSCEAIALEPAVSREKLRDLIRETYRRNPFPDAMLYVQITRGVAPRSHHIPENIRPTLVITARQLSQVPEEKIRRGATAITLADIRWKRCDIKSIALLASVLGKQEADRMHADEAFWLDEDGHLLEGCSTNCFAVIDESLVTHPLDHRVLGGITRDLAIRLARRYGLPVHERPWRLDEQGLSELFMTSTTNAAMPVCRVDGHVIGNGRPGRISMQIRTLLLQHFDELRAGKRS